jgi:hypothetical protein
LRFSAFSFQRALRLISIGIAIRDQKPFLIDFTPVQCSGSSCSLIHICSACRGPHRDHAASGFASSTFSKYEKSCSSPDQKGETTLKKIFV